jgi:hypothetical protein
MENDSNGAWRVIVPTNQGATFLLHGHTTAYREAVRLVE